ncbi:MAG: transcriptional regulator [Denitrovibrio sp.]|nr:MAG: transcriptional regulator [Denitrovibrio sp.]
MRNSIKDSVLETVKDLNEIGVVDNITLRNFDTLCLPKIPEYSPKSIADLRNKLKLSQGALAAVMNVSKSTVQKWEQGQKHPSGASIKLLSVIENKGLEALI